MNTANRTKSDGTKVHRPNLKNNRKENQKNQPKPGTKSNPKLENPKPDAVPLPPKPAA